MKRVYIFTVILSMVLLAAACSRGDYENAPDIVGGHTVVNNLPGRKYMMSIADEMVTAALDELELGLSINERGAAERSSHFNVNGSLTTPGSTWTVKAEDSQMKGLSLHCTAADQWQLSFDGEFVLIYEENLYPTVFTLMVDKYKPEDPESADEGWKVSLTGRREERGGYHCTFDTASITYVNTRGAGAPGWNQVFGDLYMYVFKNDAQVDACCLSFEGSPSQATYIRGL
jgi:hypothetical protein